MWERSVAIFHAVRIYPFREREGVYEKFRSNLIYPTAVAKCAGDAPARQRVSLFPFEATGKRSARRRNQTGFPCVKLFNSPLRRRGFVRVQQAVLVEQRLINRDGIHFRWYLSRS